VYLDGTTYLTLDSDATKWLSSGPRVSASFWIQPQSLANEYSTLLAWVSSSSADYFTLYLKSNGKIAAYFGTTAPPAAAAAYDGTGANTLVVRGAYRIDVVLDVPGQVVQVWVNNVYDNNAQFNNTPSGFNNLTTAPLVFGQDTANTGRRYTGLVSNIILARRTWEYNDVRPKDLYDNGMWSLSAPQRLVIPPTGIAPTMPVLSAATYAPGSLTSSGWIPQVAAT